MFLVRDCELKFMRLSVSQAQKAGTIKSNLKGVALGDAWISPIDSVMTWAPFLLSTVIISCTIRLFTVIVTFVRDRSIYRQNKSISPQTKFKKAIVINNTTQREKKHTQRNQILRPNEKFIPHLSFFLHWNIFKKLFGNCHLLRRVWLTRKVSNKLTLQHK